MTKKKDQSSFKDPLEGVDPVMGSAYSFSEESTDIDKTKAPNVSIADIEFPEVSESFKGQTIEADIFSNIPVEVSAELGRSNISLKEIFELSEGSIIELEKLVGEPLDLVVNGQVIAKGEVVAIDNNFGLRIKTVISKPSL